MQNIGAIHSASAEARRQQWHEDNQKVVIQPGDWVKASFPFKDTAEHMWVKVNEVQGDTIYGSLDNTPVLITDLQLGDSVTLERRQVEQLLRL